MKSMLCIGLLASVAACADAPRAPTVVAAAAAASAPQPEVTCRRVAPVGSNMSVTRCEPASTAADRMDAQDATRKLAGPGAPGAGAGGH